MTTRTEAWQQVRQESRETISAEETALHLAMEQGIKEIIGHGAGPDHPVVYARVLYGVLAAAIRCLPRQDRISRVLLDKFYRLLPVHLPVEVKVSK